MPPEPVCEEHGLTFLPHLSFSNDRRGSLPGCPGRVLGACLTNYTLAWPHLFSHAHLSLAQV